MRIPEFKLKSARFSSLVTILYNMGCVAYQTD